MSATTVSCRITKATSDKFSEKCKAHGLNKSGYLRSCIETLLRLEGEELEYFLKNMGFEKKGIWINVVYPTGVLRQVLRKETPKK